jgi:HAD superfamily hydrolase (TIGR01549 family)
VSERPTVLLDVDGTLVDSNYQHAIAWHRAFHEHGYRAAIWEIHRHVGMGGDQFVGALLGEEAENADGDELRDAHSEAYSKLIGEVEAIEGASELIGELAAAGATVVISSSGEQDEIDHYVELLGVGEKITGATTSADAERSKPDPELVRVALDRYGSGGPALMIGDSTWDVKAAAAAGCRPWRCSPVASARPSCARSAPRRSRTRSSPCASTVWSGCSASRVPPPHD